MWRAETRPIKGLEHATVWIVAHSDNPERLAAVTDGRPMMWAERGEAQGVADAMNAAEAVGGTVTWSERPGRFLAPRGT